MYFPEKMEVIEQFRRLDKYMSNLLICAKNLNILPCNIVTRHHSPDLSVAEYEIGDITMELLEGTLGARHWG